MRSGKDPLAIPMNKSDMPNVMPMDDLRSEPIRGDELIFEAAATNGIDVLDTLISVAKRVLTESRKGQSYQTARIKLFGRI